MNAILITGAAGFIGSTLADTLLAQGRRVVAVDNFNAQYDPAVKRMNIRKAMDCAEYALYETDIRDRDRILDVLRREKPGAVVHIAGSTGMKASFEQPEEFYFNNVSGTRSVLEACRIAGCPRLIYASTASVYGDGPEPADENAILPPPANPYVATKRLGEELVCVSAQNHGMMANILRLFTIYGPRQRSEMAISKFVRKVDRGLPVEIYGDGSARRGYLYIDDCVAALIQALENPFALEIFNIGGQETTTLNDLIAAIELSLGKKAKREFVAAPEGIPAAFNANTEKAKQWLAYEPKVNLNEGLDKFIAWYRENKIL